ncbi:MAG: ComEA family DNA-binding protein [Myxococcales bacterium]
MEERRRGARARALAALLAVVVAWTLARHLVRPAPVRLAEEVAGVESAGEARVVSLERAREEGRARALACRCPEPEIGPGDLLAEGCPPRVRPLPLGARRALGLAVDLDALTASELEQLPGVGPTLARRIVETRRRLGGYRAVDDLLEVPGIGPAKLEAIRAALAPQGKGTPAAGAPAD